MAKRPVISKEAEVLLGLLRFALGTVGEVSPETSFEGKDLLNGLTLGQWKEVVRLSYEHKVSALVVEGLRVSGVNPYEGLTEEKAKELKEVLEPWYNDVANIENSYEYYVEVLKTLCQIFKDNGLTPIILKGYGLSLNYPIPSHRGAGDIDLFLVDKDGRPAAKEGNRIVERVLGFRVEEEDDSHHSYFEFRGIRVENHYTLVGGLLDKNQESRQLDAMLARDVVNGDVLNFPSNNFNSIYLLLHLYKHCNGGHCTVRQIVDYVAFLRSRI